MRFFNPCGSRIWIGAAVLSWWLWTTPALGDGKVFPATAFPAEVQTPGQSALLIWSNGVERLVIETRFIGEGTNFAWVVPLPSRPEVEPATTGLFTTLRYGLQPDLRHRVTRWWGVSLFAAGLLWLLLTVRRDQPRSVIDLTACLSAAGGFAAIVPGEPAAVIGGPVLFLALLLVANRVRGGRERAYAFLLTVLLVLLMSAMLLPALAKGGSAAAAGKDGVEVLDRTMAGIYDTTTVSAKDPGALLDWLNENGFAAPTNARPIVESLVRDGWVFVAAKVHREANRIAPTTPHPLSFTFRTSKPVYPLRLTGVGGGRLAVELFVVGTERAEVEGYRTADCRRIEPTTYDGIWQRHATRKLKHPQFLAWTSHGTVITRLEANLTAADMRHDAEVTWHEFRRVRTQLYSKQGAAQTTANWVVSLVCLIVLLLGLMHHRNRIPGRRALAGSLIAIIAGAALGLGGYRLLPKTEVYLERWPGTLAQMHLREMAITTMIEMPTNSPSGVSEVRKVIQDYFAAQDSRHRQNVLLGGPIREEDSPGNYTLRETPEGVEIIGYDTAGVGISFGTVPRSP